MYTLLDLCDWPFSMHYILRFPSFHTCCFLYSIKTHAFLLQLYIIWGLKINTNLFWGSLSHVEKKIKNYRPFSSYCRKRSFYTGQQWQPYITIPLQNYCSYMQNDRLCDLHFIPEGWFLSLEKFQNSFHYMFSLKLHSEWVWFRYCWFSDNNNNNKITEH